MGNDAQQALATVDPEGSDRKVLWHRGSDLSYETHSSSEPLAWSPDGSRLLFLARTGGDSSLLEILTAAANGRGFTRIH